MSKIILLVMIVIIIRCSGSGGSAPEKELDDCHSEQVEDYVPGNLTAELSDCGVLLRWDSDDYDNLWVRMKVEDEEYSISEYVGSSNSYFVENLNYDQKYTFTVVQSNECNRLSSPIAELSVTLRHPQLETIHNISAKENKNA